MARNKLPLALSAALLLGGLCACSAPEAEPTPTAEANHATEQTAVRWLADENHRALQVGDFWVTLDHVEENQSHIQVWDPADLSAPLQTMEQELETSSFFGVSEVVDANFDGYPDFGCLRFMGNQPTYWNYWLWDPEAGQFVEEPALAEVCSPEFDSAEQVVRSYMRGGYAGLVGTHAFYRWEDGNLVCVRRTDSQVLPGETSDQDRVLLTVEDRVDGALTEVVRQEYDMNGRGWVPLEEAWQDLNYYGEV